MTDSNFPLYAAVFFITLAITVIAVKRLIPILGGRAKQPIYADGPAWHIKKSGTPTMGGLSFLIGIIISGTVGATVLYFRGEAYFAISLIITTSYAVLSAAVGIIDDLTKLKRKENAGLTAKQKLLIQSVLAILLLYLRHAVLSDEPMLHFSFGSYNLGSIYYPIAFLALVGTVNCANLTDGIDGLAASVAFAIGIALFYISFASNSEVAVVSAALIGASLGFLFFNAHPAKIFMGDTGSLLLGALSSAATLSLGNPLLILFIGSVYVIEGLSVIIQVTSFKLFGKRVFKMSPIHHHFEQCGFSENKIVLSAVFLTLIISVIAFILYI